MCGRLDGEITDRDSFVRKGCAWRQRIQAAIHGPNAFRQSDGLKRFRRVKAHWILLWAADNLKNWDSKTAQYSVESKRILTLRLGPTM
jgi:hypothetical protein